MTMPWPRQDKQGLSRFVNERSPVITNFNIGTRPLSLRPDAISIAELIYTALKNKGIRYQAGFTLSSTEQEIRTHEEVLNACVGNCLDLSLLFSAIAIDRQLVPIVIVFDDHAIVAIDRRLRDAETRFRRASNRIFEDGLLDAGSPHVAEFVDLIEQEAYAAIECTGFAAVTPGDPATAPEWQGRENGVLPFPTAIHAGLAQLRESGRNFRFAIDIIRLRNVGFHPSKDASPVPVISDEERRRFVDQVEDWLRLSDFERSPTPAPNPFDGFYSRPQRDLLDDRTNLLVKIVSHRKVTRADLLDWIDRAASAGDGHRLVVVSNLGFDEEASRLDRDPGKVRLLTADAVDFVERFRPLVRSTVAEFKGEGTGFSPLITGLTQANVSFRDLYVPRRAFRRVDPDNRRDNVNVIASVLRQPAPDSGDAVDYESVEQFVDLFWLPDEDARLLVIAGERGAGKTYVLLNLLHRFSERFLEKSDPDARLPLFFHLKDYGGEGEILRFMMSTLANYGVSVHRNLLLDLLHRGRLILLIDGFDEVAGGIGSPQALEAYRRLRDFQVPGSKMILSSRRGFFVDAHNRSQTGLPFPGTGSRSREEDSHLSILELRPYEREEILAVAKRRRPEDWTKFADAYKRGLVSDEVVRWPEQLSLVLDHWTQELSMRKSNRGETFHHIAKMRRAAEEGRQAGLWPQDLKEQLRERLAYRIGTARLHRPLSLTVEEFDEEIRQSFPDANQLRDDEMEPLRNEIVDSFYISSDRFGDIQFTTQGWLDYHHAQYILRAANEATSFERLLVPPNLDSEVAYFVKTGMRYFQNLEVRIAEFLPEQPAEDCVGQWLFWREMLSPALLQPQFDAEDARRQERQKQLSPQYEPVLRTLGEHGIAAVVVPGDRFVRGGWEILPAHRLPDLVRPPRLIRVSDIVLGANLVTNAEFQQFVEETGHVSEVISSGKGHIIGEGGQWWPRPNVSWRDPRATGQDTLASHPDHPVVQISRTDALAYCVWLAKKLNVQVRLPREAEWELAARGTLGRLYPWGNEWLNERANGATYHVNADLDFEEPYKKFWREQHLLPETTQIGKFPPNALGLFDLAGNAWEWTMDWFHPTFYEKSLPDDPANEEDDDAVFHIIRGGGWDDQPTSLKCYWRYPPNRGESGDNLGFRLAFPVRPNNGDLR